MVWKRQKALRCLAAVLATVLLGGAAQASERGTMIREAVLYTMPAAGAAQLGTVKRGQEAVLLERAPGWIHAVVTLMDAPYEHDPESSHERNLTGWMLDKGFISAATPNGDAILFGEAADSEEEASRRDGRKGAAGDARRLYYRVYDLFPNSPLAGEALYRSADIQWQLDRQEVQSRPSYKSSDPDLRPTIDEDEMRLVMKKFPNTRWADLAAYRMLENSLCGDWLGASKCPEKEAAFYEKYADRYPNSPEAAEAYYNAARRWAAVMTIYKGEGKEKKIPKAAERAEKDARKALKKNASPEWNAKARRLLYVVENRIAVWGSELE
jgi:outer membrane protein assembly factor BamD (BamD/ComL family)